MALFIAADAQTLPEMHFGENPDQMDWRTLTRDQISLRTVPERCLQIYLAASYRLFSTGA